MNGCWRYMHNIVDWADRSIDLLDWSLIFFGFNCDSDFSAIWLSRCLHYCRSFQFALWRVWHWFVFNRVGVNRNLSAFGSRRLFGTIGHSFRVVLSVESELVQNLLLGNVLWVPFACFLQLLSWSYRFVQVLNMELANFMRHRYLWMLFQNFSSIGRIQPSADILRQELTDCWKQGFFWLGTMLQTFEVSKFSFKNLSLDWVAFLALHTRCIGTN